MLNMMMIARSLLGGCALLLFALPAAAQTLPDIDKRVTRLEREVSRVARRVLPKGEQTLIEPEIGPAPDAATPPPPASATAASVSDLSERLGAIERRQRELTAQIEEQGNRLRLVEERLGKFQPDAEARLGKIEAATAPPPAPTAGPIVPPDSAQPATAASPKRGARAGVPKPELQPDPAVSGADPATPAIGAAELRYRSAYALVEAKKWPEAEPALQAFIDKYPHDKRASNARYWLGRTYYAQTQYDRAARTHFDNYKADPKGDRAQESLFWVGQSLMRLKKSKEACQVYDLAGKVYAETLKPELVDQFAAARTKAGCN